MGSTSVLERLDRRKKVVGSCWHYEGARDGAGGGLVYYRGQMRRAHRVVFSELSGREFAELGDIRRECGNRKCWNPDHLVEGFYRERLTPVAGQGADVYAGSGETHAADPSSVPERAAKVAELREKMQSAITKGTESRLRDFAPPSPVAPVVPVCEDCGEEIDPFDTHICRGEVGV